MTPRPLSRTQVHDLLERHNLAPSRALGQNFLCDPGTVDKIVRLAGIQPGDRVVEIGAGLGTLTRGLAAAGARVVAIEVDRYLVPALAETVDGLDVMVIEGDAREVDWTGVLGAWPPDVRSEPAGSGTPPRGWKVVANLPYNLATPLILDLLRDQPALEQWLVMVQREAGERLAAGPGSRVYGIPSVLASYWADVRLVGSVRAELFLPRPRVASVLVELRRHDRRPPETFPAVAELVRAGFGRRRKMLRRSLADLITVAGIEAAGVEPTARAEQLDLDAWVRLAAVARPTPLGPAGPEVGR
ncbi:MAG: 16S rRNA (adenine(1518)-N(6)/adenine(1519)-N(6))-dimethyltransferase RsmA [Acidimicrobiales bacterium]